MFSYNVRPRPELTLQEVLVKAQEVAVLPPELSQVLENSVGGKYHGHQSLDYGVISIFLNHPGSCTSRAHKTIRLDQIWGDTSVQASYLDLDQEGNPLTLDIFPNMTVSWRT